MNMNMNMKYVYDVLCGAYLGLYEDRWRQMGRYGMQVAGTAIWVDMEYISISMYAHSMSYELIQRSISTCIHDMLCYVRLCQVMSGYI